MARRYEMTGRTEAMRQTRERILDAAVELFAPAWYDEVTLGDVAARAGVTQQTVANHFGSKIDLFVTGVRERWAPGVVELRERAIGDARSIVAAIVADYEETGDGTYRVRVLADRMPELQQLVADGRAHHRAVVGRAFTPLLDGVGRRERARRLRLLAAVLDVTMWRQLRRDEGLSAAETRTHLRILVEGLLPASGSSP